MAWLLTRVGVDGFHRGDQFALIGQAGLHKTDHLAGDRVGVVLENSSKLLHQVSQVASGLRNCVNPIWDIIVGGCGGMRRSLSGLRSGSLCGGTSWGDLRNPEGTLLVFGDSLVSVLGSLVTKRSRRNSSGTWGPGGRWRRSSDVVVID